MDKSRSIGFGWEQKFIETMHSAQSTFQHIDIVYMGSKTVEEELERNTRIVFRYIIFSVLLVTIFAVGTTISTDWVTAKPLLAAAGALSVLLAIITTFGLMTLFDIRFIGINMAMICLLFGIGLDDAFVFIAAWRHTKRTDPMDVRLAQTYAEAGVAITITSITNFLCFIIGVVTPLNSVRIFNLYTGFGVLMDYFYQITFFGAFVSTHV